jgi:hypothetical protein
VKTTIQLDDQLYRRLVNEAIRRHGSAKHLSTTINELLRQRLGPVRSMFGSVKPFDLTDLRDKRDRPT